MKTAFIIHGSHGNPQENWFPWLATELQKLSYRVIVPQFPQANATGEESLQEWLTSFKKFEDLVDQNTLLIAHSKGCIFTYHFLKSIRTRIRAVFLIAPWYKYHWYRDDKPVSTFHDDNFRWDLLKERAEHFEVYQSTNDIIEGWEGEKIAKDLSAKFVLVENAGHFNKAAGYFRFPLLMDNIRNELAL